MGCLLMCCPFGALLGTFRCSSLGRDLQAIYSLCRSYGFFNERVAPLSARARCHRFLAPVFVRRDLLAWCSLSRIRHASPRRWYLASWWTPGHDLPLCFFLAFVFLRMFLLFLAVFPDALAYNSLRVVSPNRPIPRPFSTTFRTPIPSFSWRAGTKHGTAKCRPPPRRVRILRKLPESFFPYFRLIDSRISEAIVREAGRKVDRAFLSRSASFPHFLKIIFKKNLCKQKKLLFKGTVPKKKETNFEQNNKGVGKERPSPTIRKRKPKKRIKKKNVFLYTLKKNNKWTAVVRALEAVGWVRLVWPPFLCKWHGAQRSA